MPHGCGLNQRRECYGFINRACFLKLLIKHLPYGDKQPEGTRDTARLLGSGLQDAVTRGPQQTAYSWWQLSRLKLQFSPALSNRLLTATFSPPRCSPGLFRQARVKFLPNPDIPKQLSYVWTLNDMLGKRMYSTTRQCLQQSLLWPTQPADPLNTISPCLLGKWQCKPHSRFTCYIHGTKQLPNNTMRLPDSRKPLLLHSQFIVHSWEHTTKLEGF